MPASSRRRGSVASLIRGLTGGLAFCSGGNFSTGSAIALLLLRWFARRILDRVADVFLDRFQLREQAMGVGRVDAHRLLAQLESIKENVRNAIQNPAGEPPKKEQRYG